MKRSVTVGLYLAVCACLCMADNAVKNPDFSQVNPRDATAPADWTLPDGGHWKLVEGAPDGGTCLGYEAEAVVCGPVRQRVDFLTPGAVYELRARLNATGVLAPVIAVRDVGEDRELGRATTPPSAHWQTIGLRFEPVTADVELEIFADGRHYAGEQANAGKVWIAQVEVVKIADAGGQAEMPDLGENIALGAPYEMTAARYGYSRDDDDAIQLTDGVYTEGYFWTQKTTVGWTAYGLKYVKIDLGEAQPIRGMSFGTAAGVATVTWPGSITVYVSDDGENWYETAELIQLHERHDPLPLYGQYQVVRLWTDQMRTHGRWVQLVIEPDGAYTFCDEIEIFRGEDAWLAEARAGEAIVDVAQRMGELRITRLIGKQFTRDLEAAREDIAALDEGHRPFAQRADELAREIEGMEPVSMDGFRAVLPMTELEREVFALQAEVWRAQGKPALRVWHQNRWDPLAPSAEPTDDAAPALSVHMMSNEFRADVLNLTNAGEQDLRVRLRITGLPGGDNPEYLQVHQVEHVGTRHFTSVAAALPEARLAGSEWIIEAPAGMTRQVWLAFNRPDLPAGTHRGAVEVRATGVDAVDVPLTLRIYPLRFPDETTLLLGGWSYTDGYSRGLTPENHLDFIAHMQERFVNQPWAGNASLSWGTYDAEGNMTEDPSTDRFDAWQADWPDAKMYMVFLAKGPDSTFASEKPGTEMFDKKVGQWAAFWAEHMRELGLAPEQLGLLILDEPHEQAQFDAILPWARAIEAGAPGLVTWEDPQPPDAEMPREMFEAVDMLCPLRHNYISRPPWYSELLAEMQDKGKDIWFYSANGPARTFDPFSYYLLQEWHAFAIGAKGSNFWAFADNGRVSCWNEYPAPGAGPYCPIYLDDTSVTAAKYMEAIREGVEDYEYLTMLAARIEELAAAGVPAAKLAAARELVATAPARVMAGEEGPNWRWDEIKDRAVQDRVRIEILQALTELAEL